MSAGRSQAGAGEPEMVVLYEQELDAALRAFYDREGVEIPAGSALPYEEMIRREDDGMEWVPTEYDYHQRRVGIRVMFKVIMKDGFEPRMMLKWLLVLARGLMIDPFYRLTMAEAAAMVGEGKAAHSHRTKLLAGLVKASGMKGTRLSGQKSASGTANYSRAQKGNTNRRGTGKKARNLTTDGTEGPGKGPGRIEVTAQYEKDMIKRKAEEALREAKDKAKRVD